MSKNLVDNWAEQMIANEQALAWFVLALGYLTFKFRTILSPLTHLQQRFKLHPLIFWFVIGLAIVLLVWWLGK